MYGEVKIRKDEIPIIYSNIDKTTSEFNWKPKTSFLSGLKKTINFYIKNGTRL